MQKLLLIFYHLENTSKYGFSPDLAGKNGGVLSMRMQVILDSSFTRPGSAPIWGGKKGEFRDWTIDGLTIRPGKKRKRLFAVQEDSRVSAKIR